MESTEILERIQIQRLLTSLAVDSLARTSALLEKVSELSVKEVAYGLRCIELYGKLDLDTSSLKTAQCSLFGDLNESYATFPKSGMMQNGNVYQAPTLAYNGRERLYCIAYSRENNSSRCSQGSVFRKPYLSGQHTRIYPGWRTRQSIPAPRFAGKHNELPDRVDRTECIGNAVQPIIAHYLFECIKEFDRQLEQTVGENE